jgi:signal peptidase I
VRSEVAGPRGRGFARLARFGYLVLAPLALSALALRFLVPGRQEMGPGLWGTLARLGDDHPLLLGIGFYFLFTFVIRAHADRLPGGQALADAGAGAGVADDPDRLTGGWKIAASVAVIGLAALGAVIFRARVAESFRVTSSSMLPTLAPTDHVLVDKRAYGWRRPSGVARLPARGDVVVFSAARAGQAADEDAVVKRVIGLPGDRITMADGVPVINGWRAPFCEVGRYINFGAGPGGRTVQGRVTIEFLGAAAYLTLHNTDPQPPFDSYEVGPDEVFVLGDQRNGSRDSRVWRKPGSDRPGAGVPLAAIAGRVRHAIRWDRDGHLDWRALLQATERHVHLPGMDIRPMEARIAACLARPPQQTLPPSTSTALSSGL